jgi:hypothetical protein
MKIELVSQFFIVLLISFSFSAEATDLSKTCAAHGCRPGDNVLTYLSQGSPAVGCPTKQLSLYVNYVITVSALNGSSEDQQLNGEDATFLRQIRQNARVANLKAAMKVCSILKSAQQAQLVEYADRGSVKIAPRDGSEPYWTQSNHVDRE